MKISLTTKLVLSIVLAGLVPALIVGYLALSSARQMAVPIGGSYQSEAASIGDKIDRNLFERYGDVQAFGVNAAVQHQPS